MMMPLHLNRDKGNRDKHANRDKGKHEFKTNASEIHFFIAMLLVTGYNSLPRRKIYCENSLFIHNAAISNAMSHNHFQKILCVLHLSDNMNLDEQDKMTKIIPFYDMIAKCCIKNPTNTLELSIDESVLLYYGRNNSKQQMQN